MRGVFVTGTDTGAGKSVVAAAICAALVARGERVAAFKPAVTGTDEAPGEWPARPRVARWRHRAGSRARWRPTPSGPRCLPTGRRSWRVPRSTRRDWWSAPRRPVRASTQLCARGSAACWCRLPRGYSVRDLAVDLGLPIVVAARPGLGHHQPHPAHGGGGACCGTARGRDRDDALASHAGADRGVQPGDRAASWPVSACPAWRPPRPTRWPRRAPRCPWTSGCHNPADDRAHRAGGAAHSRGSEPDEDVPELLRKLQERKERHEQRGIVARIGVVIIGVVVVLAGIVLSGRACPGRGSS